jgi:hypothetical protein
MHFDRALVLTLLLVGACSSRPPEIAKISAAPRPVASVAPVASLPDPRVVASVCPPFERAAIAPRPPAPDRRLIDLGELFPREEARTPGVVPRVIDLGRVPYSKQPITGDPGGGVGIGLGFRGLDPAWVKADLTPRVAAMVDAWWVAERARSEQLDDAWTLQRRANLLRAVPPSDDGFALRCAVEAEARARDLARAQEVIAGDAGRQIVAVIEAQPTKTAAETLLLGGILGWGALRGRDRSPVASARAVQLLSGLMNDLKADSELRARAAEQLASLLSDAKSGDARVAALRQVVALTRDPEVRVDTLIKLADLAAATPAELEKQLQQILVELAVLPPDYRVRSTLTKLAQSRFDRGAFALARDAALQCARATSPDDAGEPEPWGCGRLLADALYELGGSPAGVEVPLSYLAPVGVQLVNDAIARLDRDEARRAGELVLARFPMTSEAPRVLELLTSIAPDAPTRSALVERRERDYGAGSAWLAANRARLAPEHDLRTLERELHQLVTPSLPSGSPPPTTEDERRAELVERLTQVVQGCENELAASGQVITLRIDTTGTIPKTTASGANRSLSACLGGVAATRFRSVGPAKIRAVLAGE